MEAFHGHMHQFFFAFGEYDGISIVEFPNNESTLAASKRAAGVGLMRSLPAPSVSNRLLRANNAAFDRSI